MWKNSWNDLEADGRGVYDRGVYDRGVDDREVDDREVDDLGAEDPWETTVEQRAHGRSCFG